MNIDYTKPQDCWVFPISIPRDRDRPATGAPDEVKGRGRIVSHVTEAALRGGTLVVNLYDSPEGVDWIDDDSYRHIICKPALSGQELLYIRKSTEGENRAKRVPVFIQDDEWPICCGRSMCFVGQIDDDVLCTEPPPNAKYWWHDAASFYVFTCPVCLECKATGQQF